MSASFFLIVLLIIYLGQRGAFRFASAASHHSSNTQAQEFYLKGRYFWSRRTPKGHVTQAIDYFTQAIVQGPGNAEAYVGLADCYNLLREFGVMPAAEAYPRALAAAQRAVRLDDTSAQAHNSLAFPTFWWLWKAATAEREFSRALQLNPDLVRAHHWYATYLMALHRFPDAIDQIDQAQRLDASSALLADKGYLLWSLAAILRGSPCSSSSKLPIRLFHPLIITLQESRGSSGTMQRPLLSGARSLSSAPRPGRPGAR